MQQCRSLASIGVTSLTYDITTGIATVGTGITAHGFLAGSKVKLIGAGQTFIRVHLRFKRMLDSLPLQSIWCIDSHCSNSEW